MKDLLKAKSAAKILNVSTKTLNRWCLKGWVQECGRTKGNHRLFDREVIEHIANHGLSQNDRKSCVYKIINVVSGKFYIGSTIDFEDRKRYHLSRLSNGKHPNPYLQFAFNKHGENAFSFIILEETKPKFLRSKEDEYLIKLRSYDREVGYNLEIQSNTKRHSLETRRKISESLKKHPVSDEAKLKMSKAKKGTAHHKGKFHSDETKKKISKKLKGRKGRPMSDENKHKLIEANRGRIVSYETRKKMRESRYRYLKGKK